MIDKLLDATIDVIQNPIPLKRHTAAADQQAFNNLWEERQQIAEIVHRAIRNGKKAHQPALVKIRGILERVE